MKRRLAIIAVLLFVTANAFAQDWRLETGYGIQPLHMGFPWTSPSYTAASQLAEQGQEIDTQYGFYPNVIISVAWQYLDWCEVVLTGNVSWSHHRLVQYEQFGIDPEGRPRYDLHKKSVAGWKDSSPIASCTIQWRYLWTPRGVVKLYSGLGIGFTEGTLFLPTPSVTPLGIRIGGRHLYGYIEAPLGPYATFAAGGLGWTF